MTRQRAQELWPIIKAYGEGKSVQSKPIKGQDYHWASITQPTEPLFHDDMQYRIKSEPTLRPWKPEEVPVGKLIRNTSVDFTHSPFSVILSCRGAWVGFVSPINAQLTEVSCQFLLDNEKWEHSIDGKTWSRCGVFE